MIFNAYVHYQLFIQTNSPSLYLNLKSEHHFNTNNNIIIDSNTINSNDIYSTNSNRKNIRPSSLFYSFFFIPITRDQYNNLLHFMN